jgi:hypothetical protein
MAKENPTKKKEKAVKPQAGETPTKAISAHSEVFSKPKDLDWLLASCRKEEVNVEALRPRLQTEAVEHGRGYGIARNYAFRKFKGEVRAVLYVTMPRPKGGGSFEPIDRLMKPGESMRLTYKVKVEGSPRPIFFLAKGYFLRKSFFLKESPDNPDKPWVGSREDAVQTLSKELVVRGEEIVELRIDNITSFPNGPGHLTRDMLDRYLSQASLHILPGGGGWNQKSTQGNFFDSIRDPLEQYISRDKVKCIETVQLDDFSNLGVVTLVIKERLLSGLDHEVARPSVVKNPNDFLAELNVKLGFLLRFRMQADIAEALGRTFPKKAGKEDEVYLPLLLDRVEPAREHFRLSFRLFPRDLIEESRRGGAAQGLKFMPPYALHPGAENHNTYGKLLILISKRFREDEKPEEEKLKSEKLQASVEKRIAERKHAFVDPKVKAAFQQRVAAKKREED